MDLITYIIHFRYDVPKRLINLHTIIDYYSKIYPESLFYIVEDDKKSHESLICKPNNKNVIYYFMKNDSLYHRTKAFNIGIKNSTTDIIGILDTDCIINPKFILPHCEMLKKDTTMIVPYNGTCIDINQKLHDDFLQNHDYDYLFSIINKNIETDKFKKRQGVCSSGVIFYNRQHLIECGGYNEKFIAWGAEDHEIVYRLQRLGYKFYRETNKNALLFHLPHPHSLKAQHPYYSANVEEMRKIMKMPKEDMLNYIQNKRFFC